MPRLLAVATYLPCGKSRAAVFFMLFLAWIAGVGFGPVAAALGQPLKFGSFDNLKNVKLTISDSNGTPVTFTLSGGGYGEIAGDSSFSQIILSGTTAKSLLSIKTIGRGTKTSVGDIISVGPLKGIMAATTSLRGTINIGGGLNVLRLDDAIDANTIIIGSSSNSKAYASIFLDQVRNLSITSGMPISVLKVTEWLDSDQAADRIMAPCVSVLRVGGDKKLGIGGTFEAGLQLYGLAGKSCLLSNAKIAGDLTDGVWNINGDAGVVCIDGALDAAVTIHGSIGNLKVRTLGGNIIIDGDARRVKINQPLAICAPSQDVAGQLHVGGSAAVQSNKDNFKMVGGDLYASTGEMYRLEDLRGYDLLGMKWFYSVSRTVRGMGKNESGTDDIVVNVDTATGNSNGHECRVINTVSEVDGNSSTLWYTDDAGTHLAGWSIDGAIGTIAIETDSVVAPAFLQLGQKYTATAPFTGQWTASVNGQQIAGSITGFAQVSSKLVGHGQVVMHTDTYLAANVEEAWNFNGDIQLEYNGMQYQGKFSAQAARTWCGVAGVGIVKSTNSETVQIDIPGGNGISMAVQSTDELTGFELPEVSE
jgi:hypothetical protein